MTKKNSFLTIFILGILSIILLLPLLATLLNSIFRDFTGMVPKGFTLSFYAQLMTGKMAIFPVLLRTIVISVVPVFILLVVLLLAMYAIQLYFPKIEKYVDILSKIPYGIQGVILAVSILSLYSGKGGILSNRIFLLACAYCIVILPFMYQGIKNAFITINMIPILEAAEILGASKPYAYFRIIVPSITKGLLATMILSTGILFGDFVLVNILAGSHYKTMGIFFNEIRSSSGHIASAVSVIMFLCMFILSYLVSKLKKQKEGNKEIRRKKEKEKNIKIQILREREIRKNEIYRT